DGAAAEAAVGGPAAAPELLGAVRAQRLTRRQHLRRGEAAHGDAASCVGAAPGVWQACPPAAALGRRAGSRAPATNTPASTRRPTTPPSRARRSATKLIAASATLVVSAKVAIARAPVSAEPEPAAMSRAARSTPQGKKPVTRPRARGAQRGG